MSLTDLQYRYRVIWVSMGLLFGVFTSVEFLRNLSLHVQHGQTMAAAIGLAFLGTIVYAIVTAIIVTVLGFILRGVARTFIGSDMKGKDHE